VQRYQQGERMTDLASSYGCSRHTLQTTLRRLGAERRPLGRARWLHLTPEQIEDAAARWVAGQSCRVIARSFEVSQDFMTRTLREAGCEIGFRPRPPGPFGPDSAGWKGGRTVDGNGYVRVWVGADDLFANMRNQTGYVLEHRLVMARHLGRPLLRSETVHHKNTDHADNRWENLQLRQGQHGTGAAWVCLDCGSHNIQATALAT